MMFPLRIIRKVIFISLLTTLLLLVVLAPTTLSSVDVLVQHALCDVRILYLAGEDETIDWATLYYLNDYYGCAVDVMQPNRRATLRVAIRDIPDHNIVMRRVFLPDDNPALIDSVVQGLFSHRRPDIVLIGWSPGDSLFEAFRDRLVSLEPSQLYQFNIRRLFEQIDTPVQIHDSSIDQVVLNTVELHHRYRERMRAELPLLGIAATMPEKSGGKLVRYQLLSGGKTGDGRGVDFLSGLTRFQLINVLEDLLPPGPKRETLVLQARKLISSLQSSFKKDGRAKVDAILDGYRTMLDLQNAVAGDSLLMQSRLDLKSYFDNLTASVQTAALEAVGIRWEGKVILRDSPRGPKLKYRASLSANGPKEVRLKSVWFLPYWDTARVPIDTISVQVTPHQSFVREYLIDIDRQYLEAEQPDSLVFVAEIEYGPIPLTARSTLPIWGKPILAVSFEPDFYFVQSPVELDIDRVVSSTTVRAVITKPSEFTGEVNFEFITPRGLFAGVYRKNLDLRAGRTNETIRVPFSISKLFELGIQHLIIELSQNGRLLATDTAIVRIASCRVPDIIKIGFLPDTSGALEDILQMTDATFRPLTNRGLITANLEAYDVLIVGSGAHRNLPSLAGMKDSFEEYMRRGGSLVLLGQPEDWPEGMLPVSLAPALEIVDRQGITSQIEKAQILSHPYRISEKNLFSSFFTKREVSAAIVAPAEIVFATPSGAALLSISRIGDGQLIYCGLPLFDLIARLDIDAVHLFANILNY
ncbi:MAG: hypothetical protein DRP47_05510 [Candidatus Zixiibacteriota bacterium]|nr:MAG: hypothetical protein DRP47_05510 [candidate division Zixibacteria bacterium]